MTEQQEKELKAYTFSYLWVAAADGVITKKESSHFLEAITELNRFDLSITRILNDLFLDTRDYFNIKYKEAQKEAAERIKEFKENTIVAPKIIAVARLGVIADDAIEEREELVIRQIADLLDFNNP